MGECSGNLCVTIVILSVPFRYASGAESVHVSFNDFCCVCRIVGSALGCGHFAAVGVFTSF